MVDTIITPIFNLKQIGWLRLFSEEDDVNYNLGNYFKTEQEAQEYAEYMKKRSLEWHEKRDK